MALLAQRSSGSRRRLLADINVVPYIDVMLVLVVILMVTAPFVNPSLVELPSMGKAARAPDAPIEIVVRQDGRLLLRERAAGGGAGPTSEMTLEQIIETVRGKQRTHPDTPVVISGDRSARYESITQVMDALYKAQVRRVGLSVRPAG